MEVAQARWQPHPAEAPRPAGARGHGAGMPRPGPVAGGPRVQLEGGSACDAAVADIYIYVTYNSLYIYDMYIHIS